MRGKESLAITSQALHRFRDHSHGHLAYVELAEGDQQAMCLDERRLRLFLGLNQTSPVKNVANQIQATTNFELRVIRTKRLL